MRLVKKWNSWAWLQFPPCPTWFIFPSCAVDTGKQDSGAGKGQGSVLQGGICTQTPLQHCPTQMAPVIVNQGDVVLKDMRGVDSVLG